MLKLDDFSSNSEPSPTGLHLDGQGSSLFSLGNSRDELKAAIGTLELNQIRHIVSKGSWSNHQLVKYLLLKFGPAHLYMTTWSMTEDPLRQLVQLRHEGLILSARCILSERINERTPGVMQFANSFFDELKLLRLHAKVTVLMGENYGLAVVGSANFTRNPRVEAGIIDTHLNAAHFHKNWITDELRKSE